VKLSGVPSRWGLFVRMGLVTIGLTGCDIMWSLKFICGCASNLVVRRDLRERDLAGWLLPNVKLNWSDAGDMDEEKVEDVLCPEDWLE
jgi:hypothetical protein